MKKKTFSNGMKSNKVMFDKVGKWPFFQKTAPVVFCHHKIRISFIPSKKEKTLTKKQTNKKLNIYKYFVCLILTLKNVQF